MIFLNFYKSRYLCFSSVILYLMLFLYYNFYRKVFIAVCRHNDYKITICFKCSYIKQKILQISNLSFKCLLKRYLKN